MTIYTEKKIFISQNLSRKLLLIISTILLIIGIFFRFVNLDTKFYYGDEVYTSLRVSGYTVAEMNEQLQNGSLLTIQDLQKYQHTNVEKNTIDTIKGLALEESQVAPLYFVLVRFWVEWFGNSVAVTRSFSAFISLLTFPCLYWLCQELFASSLITWIAIGLVAISPVHVLYAQEARGYSLWIVTILLSSAALLRAMRLKTKIAWWLYAATLALGLYTQILSIFVAFAQGIYVLIIERLRLTKTLVNYLIASVTGFLAFIPWFLVMIIYPASDMVSWTNTKQTFLASSIRWAGIVSRTFIDLGVAPNDTSKLKVLLIPFVLVILALIIYSIYFICRKTPQRIWLFVLTLTGSIAFPLMVIDFVFERRYGTTRYILPSILGIQLAVAYLFSNKIALIVTKFWQKKLWAIVMCMVIISGITSCLISSQANMWWNKFPERNQQVLEAANIINQSSNPLVITDTHLIPIQTLSYLLEPKVRFQITTPQAQIPEISNGFSDVFLYTPSDYLKAGIEKVYNSPLKQTHNLLWHCLCGQTNFSQYVKNIEQ